MLDGRPDEGFFNSFNSKNVLSNFGINTLANACLHILTTSGGCQLLAFIGWAG
jgi:hypothetical protein